MSINTNGFITEYVKEVQNKEWLIIDENDVKDIKTMYDMLGGNK
jgi:hypothetical protein